jgi:Predicted membrane protein
LRINCPDREKINRDIGRKEHTPLLIGIVRTIILYLIIVLVLRVMGKRQIGQLQPFELVIILMISELAVIPSQDSGIPLVAGLFPVLILLLLGLAISEIALKYEKARGIICGKPTILINKGQILEAELRKLRYNLSDLLEQLRAKNLPNIADVEYAILETNGQLSVIPKTGKRPVNMQDLKLQVIAEGLPLALIMDGKLQQKNLEKSGVNIQWLNKELTKANVPDIKKVFFASIDSQRKLYIQPKADPNK